MFMKNQAQLYFILVVSFSYWQAIDSQEVKLAIALDTIYSPSPRHLEEIAIDSKRKIMH